MCTLAVHRIIVYTGMCVICCVYVMPSVWCEGTDVCAKCAHSSE